MSEFLRCYGHAIEFYFLETKHGSIPYVKKKYGLVLTCSRCGKRTPILWTDNHTGYCDECFEKVKNEQEG